MGPGAILRCRQDPPQPRQSPALCLLTAHPSWLVERHAAGDSFRRGALQGGSSFLSCPAKAGGYEKLRDIANIKKRWSTPGRAKNADPFAVLRASSEGRRYKGERCPPRGRRVARHKDSRTVGRGDTVARWPRRRRSFAGISRPVQALSQSPLCESARIWPWLQCPSVLHSRAACRRSCWRSSR